MQCTGAAKSSVLTIENLSSRPGRFWTFYKSCSAIQKGSLMLRISFFLTALFVMFAVPAAAQVDPMNPAAAREFYKRGLKREGAKQFKEAINDYRKAAELDPGCFDAHFTLSSLHAELKDYRASIGALAKSLKARPKDYSALFNSGLYHEYLRDYDEAIAHYTQASAEDANFSHYGGSANEARARAYHYRGRVYQWYKKENAKAVDDFTSALRLDPKIEMVRYRRARAYHDLKEYAKANADFAAARDLDPDYPNLLNAWAWQLATCPDARYRDGRLALELAKKTNDMDTLAASYAEIGEFDDAVASQKRAIRTLDRLPKPKNEQAKKRRHELKEKMELRLASYEAKRPYRDE